MGTRRQTSVLFSENERPVSRGTKRLIEADFSNTKRAALSVRQLTSNVAILTRKGAKAPLKEIHDNVEQKKAIVHKATPRVKLTNVMVPFEEAEARDFYAKKTNLPTGVVDIDRELLGESSYEPHYAHASFDYLRSREETFQLKPYLQESGEITAAHRVLLVDWLVEAQENFEVNHEALYLAVKLSDCFMSKKVIGKKRLQLLGATALLIAIKVYDRIPPQIEEFEYICDGAYPVQDFIEMEREILETLNFDVSIPLSYCFLRRYCRTINLNMRNMTLARFILECSLLEYSLITYRESELAAASLLLALDIIGFEWNETLEFYTGYKRQELVPLRNKLNRLVQRLRTNAQDSARYKNKTIVNKYSHNVFFNVATLEFPPVE